MLFFFHRKLQNFKFKNYLHHYLKRSAQVLVDRTQHPPFLHPTPLFSFSDCISRLIHCYVYRDTVFCDQLTDAIRKRYHQSTDAIRKRYLYIHISRLMQSENGILLLFYIFLSHGNGKK